MNFIDWLLQSNRLYHLVGGFFVALITPFAVLASLWCTFAVACALEFKDVQHGGKWDWVDLAMTMFGAVLSCFCIKVFVLGF